MEELDLTSTNYGAEEDDEDEEDEEGAEEEEVDERVPRGKRSRRDMLASEAIDFHASLADGASDEDDDDGDEGEEVSDSMLAGLDDDELEALMGELGPGDGAEELMKRVRAKQAQKMGLEAGSEEDDEEMLLDGEESDEAEGDEDEEEQRRIAAARAAKKQSKRKGGAVPSVPALAPLPRGKQPSSAGPAASTLPRPSASAASDYLDPLALSASDVADKASSRHTLRFHVSQVAQKAARREARRVGLEGDDDVPRRSKEQARREVLKRQEHGAAKDAKERAALDEGEFDDEDRKAARAVRGEGADGEEEGGGGWGDDDDYYDLVAAEKDEGRRAKKAKYEDDRAAEKCVPLSFSLALLLSHEVDPFSPSLQGRD